MPKMQATIQLTEVEINHLLTLLHDAEEVGSYYGPKFQYWERHHRIMDKLAGAQEALDK